MKINKNVNFFLSAGNRWLGQGRWRWRSQEEGDNYDDDIEMAMEVDEDGGGLAHGLAIENPTKKNPVVEAPTDGNQNID